MADLKPAGFFSAIGSYFFPKQVSVEVRTETLPGGQVEITPRFSIDGHEVASNLLTPNANQKILGYYVALDEQSLSVHKQTQGRRTRLAKRKAAEFLNDLSRRGIAVRSKNGQVRPRIETVKPDVELELRPDDTLKIHSELQTADGVVLDKPTDLDQLRADEGWFAVGDDLLKVETSGSELDSLLLAHDAKSTLTGDEVPQFLKLLEQKSKHVGEISKSDSLKDLSVFSGNPANQVKVDGDADSISISTALVYSGTQGRHYEQTPKDTEELKTQGGGFRRVDEGWIDVSMDAIEQFGEAQTEMVDRIGASSTFQGTDIPEVLSTLVGATRRDGTWNNPWSVYFSEAVKNSHRIIDTAAQIEFRLNIVDQDGRSLFELDPIYNHERFQLRQSEVEAATKSGEDWIRRRDAWIKVDHNKFDKIDAGVRQLDLERSPGGFTFPASQREQVLELFSIIGSIEHSTAYAQFLAKLADYHQIEDVPLPTNLRSAITFRPYQKHGFNWLAFLHRFGLNGILADDMGLGKTLQTLAVIQRANEQTSSRYPSLIICPTSVVSNWRSEVGKFFRNCDVITYTGSSRQKKLWPFRPINGAARHGLKNPVVITSYDIARLDHEQLNQIAWLYVVVDEGHNIKNPDAKRTRAIKTITAQHKLALTGTPIQNKLDELWSLFDFAMPGYLGTRTDFRNTYGRNSRENWAAVQNGATSLKERIHPFMMRRLKIDVAKDLPPKIIVDQKVELTAIQVELYQKVIGSQEYKRMEEEIDKKGVARSEMAILAALSKLRAICNHPFLADKQGHAEIKYKDSGKLDCLKELMAEIMDGEHRALLFSQSTQMLDIIEDFFHQWKIKTVRLDGRMTPKKKDASVDAFKKTSSIHCFLLSTKPGGTGLNLTSADTVIFYDHDWNPANDKQAQDRAYRIGQEKPVTVYRLISKGTIEEKILELQAIKQSLADEIIGTDEEGFKNLTKEELLSLFTFDADD